MSLERNSCDTQSEEPTDSEKQQPTTSHEPDKASSSKPDKLDPSLRFLHDHLLLKKRQKSLQVISSKVNDKKKQDQISLSQKKQNDKKATKIIEQSLWDSENEYDPQYPNNYFDLIMKEMEKQREAATKKNTTKRSKQSTKGSSTDSDVSSPISQPKSRNPSVVQNPPASSNNYSSLSTDFHNNQQDKTSAPSSSSSSLPVPPDAALSPVIMLQNMVGPGEVDENLEDETKEECEKYGKVIKCLIYEIPHKQVPDNKAVRIFVEFRDIASAKNAVSDLDGRYFGGRTIKALFYNQERFKNYDLRSE